MKVLLVSDLSGHALGNSFIRAFRSIGIEPLTFDLGSVESKYSKLGKIGKKVHTFWPVEAWIRKANRELAIEFRHQMPDLVMVVGNVQVLYGVLAFLRSLRPCKIVLYWPDTLINLTSYQKESATLYDAVATYSSSTIEAFKQIGFREALFFPFAGDVEFLGSALPGNDFAYDISFAGGWRPEREATLASIVHAFPELKVLIKGTDWERFCTRKELLKFCEPKPVYGKNFGDFIRQSRINLNVIDDTNYPAANMRFFEVPAVGGLQLSSSCPEMENILLDKEDILYYRNESEMLNQVNWVLNNPAEASRIRQSAREKIAREHTYSLRIQKLLSTIGL
jgi:spore maturation protein CgeB